MKPHMQARTEVHAEYEGKRFKVADESVPWSKDAPLYRPNEFTDDSVLTEGVAEGWADPHHDGGEDVDRDVVRRGGVGHVAVLNVPEHRDGGGGGRL